MIFILVTNNKSTCINKYIKYLRKVSKVPSKVRRYIRRYSEFHKGVPLLT